MKRRGRLRTWMGLALLMGLAWRCARYTAVFPMWGDEAFLAVNFFTRDFWGMLRTLDHDMVASLGFLWTNLAVSELLGRAEWALRLLPWFAGILAFVLFWRMARGLLRRHAALVAVAIFAASYYPVRHAAEVKPYSLDMLLSIPILWLAWRIRLDPSRRGPWAGYTLFTSLAVWFSYTSIFVSGGAALILGWRVLEARRKPWISAWLVHGILLTASFAAMYALVGAKQQWDPGTIRAGQWARHIPPLAEPMKLPLWLLRQHTGNMFAYPNGGRDFGCAATTLLVILASVALWRRGRRSLVLLLLSPLPLMFVAAALYKYPYGGSARTTLYLAAPICLLAGEGMIALLGRWLRPRRTVLAVRAVAVLMLAMAALGVVKDLAAPYKKISDARNRDMVRWLAQRTGLDDQWAVFGRFGPCDFAPDLHHWGGSAARMRYYLLLHARRPVLWAPEAEALDPSATGKTWLVVYRDNNIAFPEAQWEDYRKALLDRLGIPKAHSFSFDAHEEKAEILEFDAP